MLKPIAALSFVTLLVPCVASAHAKAPTIKQVKAIVNKELAPKKGWLPTMPATYKEVSLAKLRGAIVRPATQLQQVSDTFQIWQRNFGARKIFVIETSNDFENGFSREVVDARGKSIF